MTMGKESISTVIENNPKVTILLLNYNGWEDAIECLESVYKIMYPNWEVILVDNGSEDDSVSKIKEWAAGKIQVESEFFGYDAERKPIEYIEELFYDEKEAKVKALKKEKERDMLLPHQKLSILRIEKNRGFTGGNNIGIEYILKERKTDYILLLSNDTVVDKEFLEELVKVAESDERIGIVGPKIYYYDYNGRSDVINFLGADLIMWKGLEIRYGTGEIDRRQWNTAQKVDKIEGSCMLIKEEVFRDVGLLNPKYFAYWEDSDFCTRAKGAGYTAVCVPKAKIWHKEAATNKKIRGFYESHMTRNMFWFMKQHATRRQYLLFLLYFFGFRFWFTAGIYLVYHRDICAFTSFFKGVIDGMLHRGRET